MHFWTVVMKCDLSNLDHIKQSALTLRQFGNHLAIRYMRNRALPTIAPAGRGAALALDRRAGDASSRVGAIGDRAMANRRHADRLAVD